jgi:hypothetical protein
MQTIVYFVFFTLAVLVFLGWWAAVVNNQVAYEAAPIISDKMVAADNDGSPGAAERTIDLLYGGKLV